MEKPREETTGATDLECQHNFNLCRTVISIVLLITEAFSGITVFLFMTGDLGTRTEKSFADGTVAFTLSFG